MFNSEYVFDQICIHVLNRFELNQIVCERNTFINFVIDSTIIVSWGELGLSRISIGQWCRFDQIVIHSANGATLDSS